MKKSIFLSIILLFTGLSFGQITGWSTIDDPGDIVDPADIEMVIEDIVLDEEIELIEATEEEIAAHAAHVVAVMREKFPPVLSFSMTIPTNPETVELSPTEPSPLSYVPGHTYLEVDLDFTDGNDLGLCLQLIPVETLHATSPTSIETEISSNVQMITDICNNVDNSFKVTATQDIDGIFRFDLSKIAALIESGEIGNNFIIRPFSPKDAFEIPDRSPFRFVKTI